MAIPLTDNRKVVISQEEDSSFITVETWNDDVVRAISSLTVSTPPKVRGTSVALSIPLDDAEGEREVDKAYARRILGSDSRKGRPSLQRDSLRRREEILKGKEGSRRRQRWENDRLLGNPHVQPPLPLDWEIHPTYPVQVVPYYLASLWDAKRVENEARRATRGRSNTKTPNDGIGRVPKALREKLKRSRGAKGLLQALEQEIRIFVETWEERERLDKIRQQQDEEDLVKIDFDSEDDEVVFVGRDGSMHSRNMSIQTDGLLQSEKLVFDSLEDDQSASFGRWLVHSLGEYYGLKTWSITVGNPARREAYVGINEIRFDSRYRNPLPRPLWARV